MSLDETRSLFSRMPLQSSSSCVITLLLIRPVKAIEGRATLSEGVCLTFIRVDLVPVVDMLFIRRIICYSDGVTDSARLLKVSVRVVLINLETL